MIVKKVGTKGFMAPEVAQREPYDFKCDIYSLGVILLILIAKEGALSHIDSKTQTTDFGDEIF